MKLQQKVAQRNKKYINHAIAAGCGGDSNGKSVARSGSLSAQFFDSEYNPLPTRIAIDNVLVFGGEGAWIHELASLIQLAFSKVGKLSQLISVPKFFAMPVAERRDPEVSYIITCDDHCISAAKLSELNSFVGSVCSFKIAGLDWKRSECGQFEISARAQDILDAFQVKEKIVISFLASLSDREFCIITPQNIFKRCI